MVLGDFKCVEETSQFKEDFIKSYNDYIGEWYFLAFDVQYPENLHDLRNDLHFLPTTMKVEKLETLVVNLNDKEEYVMHLRNLKQVLNHGSVL